MPQRLSIDDKNTSLIQYSGDWEFLDGSSREWQSGVHTTSEEGANATFRFRGYQVWVWGTIPAGTGINLIDISVDGNAPNSTSRTSNGSAVYEEQYYASPVLRDTYHTLVVTNRGSVAQGNSEFLLDLFEFETNDEVPMFTPPNLPTSSGASGVPAATVTLPADSAASTSPKTPWGGIIGVIVAIFAIIIAALVFVLMRRRRQNGLSASNKKLNNEKESSVTPRPFPLVAPRNLTNLSPTFQLLPLRSSVQPDSELNSSRPNLSVLTSTERPSEKSGNLDNLRTVSPVSLMSQSHYDPSTSGYESISQSSNPNPFNAHQATSIPITPGVPPPSYWQESVTISNDLHSSQGSQISL
ncbi:hypothetical protein CPB83DRAFT_899708 [Crepidotus variabilis]|uniref:Uncharacterized protein n=1 Tax=Crepidotus variabilis TaxID=179855 RepID=A0A9P6E4D6_9AGAR|nr:hypothetical protein CPB83DRAFT_899708 [Crepidotus variabilis]